MRTLRQLLLHVAFLVVVLTGFVGTAVAQSPRNSTWAGGVGNWFGPADTCVSWTTCAGPGTNPGESGFTDNVFINMPGSAVTVNGGAVIANLTLASGNSLTTIGTGYLQFTGSGAATLSNAGTITLQDSSGINVDGVPAPNMLTLTVSGGGMIVMASPNAHIGGLGGNLVNQETIEGQGSILQSGFVVNHGIINANISGGTLSVQTGVVGMTNTGTLQASNGGILDLVSGFSTIVLNNTGGTIQALGGSTVLNQEGIIVGGTLTTAGTGIIQTVGANPTLENLTNAGTYQILPGGDTTLVGTINNTGSLLVGSNTGGAQLFINGAVTLTGPGTITMVDSNNPLNTITSVSAGSQLTNQQTIQGTGMIGDANLTVTNQGVINANVAAHPLRFADAGFANMGMVEATNGATLNIFSATFDNQGTLRVDPGSTINFSGNSSLLNYNGATNTLTGGTYLVGGTLQFTNSIVAVNTNAANITLNGAGSRILNGLGTDALAGLAMNAPGASFTIENGRNFTTAGDFQNSGTLTVGNGSTFMTGSGATNNYAQNGASSLTDIQNGGQFNTSTYLQNAGTTLIETGGKLTAGNFNWNGGILTVNGNFDPLNLAVCASCTLAGSGTVAANVTSSGTVRPGAPGPPPSPGTLSIHGNYIQTAGGTLAIDLGGTGIGQFGVLDVTGNAALDGTVDFTAINGFAPVAGDDFTFLLFGTESGNFSNVVFTNWTCPANDTCTDVFGSGTLSLDISGTQTPVPEPSSALLLGTGLLGLAVYFNRKTVVARQ